MAEPVSHEIAEIFIQDDVLHYRYRKGAVIELEGAREVVALAAELVSSPMRTLVDIRGLQRVSADARRYFSSSENMAVSSATAILVDGAVSRMIGNFFIRLNRPPVEILLFDDEEVALAWLKERE